MSTATILARAILTSEDIGDLTKDLPEDQRASIEYAYNQAKDMDWDVALVDSSGLALGAIGVIQTAPNGTLQSIKLAEEEIESDATG